MLPGSRKVVKPKGKLDARSGWFQLAIIVFVGFLLYNQYQSINVGQEKLDALKAQVIESLDKQRVENSSLNLPINPISIQDINIGTGNIARCGAESEIKYKSSDMAQEAELKFVLGQDNKHEILSNGTIGMKVGGKRRIIYQPSGTSGIDDALINIELMKVEEYISDTEKFKILNHEQGNGEFIKCGDEITASVKYFDDDWNLLAEETSTKWHLGDASAPIFANILLIKNIRKNSKLLLHIPPAGLNTLDVEIDLTIDSNKPIFIELEI